MKKIGCIALVLLLVLSVSSCKKRVDEPIEEDVIEDVLVDGTYEGTSSGFSGPITVEIVIENEAFVEAYLISQSEGDAVGSPAVNLIIQQLNEGKMLSPVDLVAGATQSSYGTIGALNQAFLQAGALYSPLEQQNLIPAPSTLKLGTSYSYDVVIIGGGGAGLTAAISAAQEGAQVAVLERNSFVGGTTLLSQGLVNSPSSSTQFLEDIQAAGGQEEAAPITEVFAEQAAATISWLEDMGIVNSSPKQASGHTQPRTVNIEGGGMELVEKLVKQARSLGVDIYVNSIGTDITQKEGRISGVVVASAHHPEEELCFLEARKGVIIATGGFASNSTLLAEYCPTIPLTFSISGSGYDTGSGLLLAQPYQAQRVTMNQLQVTPYSSVQSKQNSPYAQVLKHGGVLANEFGYIYPLDELTEEELIQQIAKDGQGFAFLLWDQQSLEKTGLKEPPIQAYAPENDFFVGTDLQDVAIKLGIRGQELGAYAQEIGYSPVGPLTGQKVAVAITGTLGGLGVDASGQVLEDSGTPIPGLYAAGEVVGGVHGEHALEGNMLTSALVLGHLAGQSAGE